MMKNVWRMLLLAGVFTVLLCGSALAAGTASEELGAGFYLEKSTAMTIKPVTEADAEITAKTIVKDDTDYSYYQDAVKMEVSCAATEGKQYLVMLVTGSFEDVPTASNTIIYVDQKAADGSTVTFGEASNDYVYPNLAGLGQDEPLTLLITSNDGTAMKKTALYYSTGGSYDVKQYKLGDVDEKNGINATDASYLLQFLVNKVELTASQKLAADVDGRNGVNSTDASYILQFLVNKIPSFESLRS